MTIARRLQSASGSAGTAALSLPRIPWEGGPAYWSQFSKTAAAGWADPSFFPILIDPCPFSSQSEIQWDKDHGINTYAGSLNEWTPWDLLEPNNMYYLGEKYSYLPTGQMMPDNYAAWVGYRLGDETDGIYADPSDGYAHLQGLIDTYSARNDGRFMYNNYTQMTVLQAWQAYGSPYINNFTDAVSMDMYWYTIPDTSYGNTYVSSVNGPGNPRSATSYGAMVRGMRQVDDDDAKLQPIWFYVENYSGGPGEQFVRYIEPGELKGAVMSCIIAEARGIAWFNSAMSAPQGASPYGNVLRTAQYDSNFPGMPQIVAMGEVNNQIQSLAPIINTQSYLWSFGANLETMLKTYNGDAYIFAMCANNTAPGSRTFTLPEGINGTIVEVVDESRTFPVSGGQFTDTFTAEYSYHIYKIAL